VSTQAPPCVLCLAWLRHRAGQSSEPQPLLRLSRALQAQAEVQISDVELNEVPVRGRGAASLRRWLFVPIDTCHLLVCLNDAAGAGGSQSAAQAPPTSATS
jgi:hypothetical protein